MCSMNFQILKKGWMKAMLKKCYLWIVAILEFDVNNQICNNHILRRIIFVFVHVYTNNVIGVT